MALFINVDPVAPRWWKRKVPGGWQFGYSGGTENDFMIDIEVAKWRFACYIGMKKVQNWAPGYEKHLKWRKEQEYARRSANKPESAYRQFFNRRRNQTAANRMDQKYAKHHIAFALRGFIVVAVHKLRLWVTPHDCHHKDRVQLAARHGVPSAIHGNAITPIEGQLLHEEHQRPAPNHAHHKDSEAGELSEGAD